MLDHSLTIQSVEGSSTDYKACESSQTRTIHHVEVHSSAKFVCFCADDEDGNGQLYTLCPGLISKSEGPDGNEIVQLTEGAAHCDEKKSWTCNDMIVISSVHDEFSEVQVMDPETDPLTADCFDTDAGFGQGNGGTNCFL